MYDAGTSWKKYTPGMLKQPVSAELRESKRRKVVSDKISEYASARVALNEVQKQAFMDLHEQQVQIKQREHEQRMKHEEALHSLRMAEIQERIQQAREKHKAEMKKLQCDHC